MIEKTIKQKRGRPKFAVPRVDRHVSLNAEVFRDVEELLRDPFRQAIRVGGLSGLVNELLTKWVAEQKKLPEGESDNILEE